MGQGIKVDKPQSYASIEAVSRRVRNALVPGTPVAEGLPGIGLFERLQEFCVLVEGKKIPLSYGVQNLPDGVEGLTRYEANDDRIVVYLSESTYADLEREDARARFSAVHEIGHAVLHPAELVRLAEIPHSQMGMFRAKQGDHESYMDSEWQANSFAAALLMPAAGIVELEMKYGPAWILYAPGIFGTSYQATEIRGQVFKKRRSALLR